MKEWKDGKDRFELRLDDKEACVMYHDEAGYYVSTYLNGGCQEVSLDEKSLDAAKKAAEKWYAERLRTSIEMHERCILDQKGQLKALAEDEGHLIMSGDMEINGCKVCRDPADWKAKFGFEFPYISKKKRAMAYCPECGRGLFD